jgi:hypothetical protein
MEMLERYLNAVRFWLPASQQDDIIAEIREDIRSQVEDRETELGRKLDENEMAAILTRRGHPTIVASSYLPKESLIGPALFPIYRFVLKMVVLWILAPIYALILGPIMFVTSSNLGQTISWTIGTFISSASIAICIMTLVFALIERYAGKSALNWDPRKLPRLPVRKAPGERSPLQTQATAVVEIIMGLVVGLWMVSWFPLSFHLNVIDVTLAPVWQGIYWPTIILIFGSVPLGIVTLMYPSRPWLRSVIRIALSVLSLAIAGYLMNAGTLVDLSAPANSATGIAEAIRWTNIGIRIGLVVMSLSAMFNIGQELYRIYRWRNNQSTFLNQRASTLR